MGKEKVLFVLERLDGLFYHGSGYDGPSWKDYPKVYARLSDLKNSYMYHLRLGNVNREDVTILKVKLSITEEMELEPGFYPKEDRSYFV